FTGSDSLDDSVIWQDFNGRIGIGTQRPGTALLTVAGQIETTSGGIKFPNGTVQLTSADGALFQVIHNATLTGNGTGDSPLGVNIPALNLLSNVVTNGTLSGNGTSASPLGVTVPLKLTGSSGFPILDITNIGMGPGVRAMGSNTDSGMGGDGVEASGGNIGIGGGGTGVKAFGGNISNINDSGVGGNGVDSLGGVGESGGNGVTAQGGNATNGAGGIGIVAAGGLGGNGVRNLAASFLGSVSVTGNLSKGGGSF